MNVGLTAAICVGLSCLVESSLRIMGRSELPYLASAGVVRKASTKEG